MPETLIQGVLERTLYENEKTEFTVANIKKKEVTTIVGKLIGVNPRETLELQEGWIYKDLSDSQLHLWLNDKSCLCKMLVEGEGGADTEFLH